MGHQDKGKFAAKHKNRKIDEGVSEKIRSLGENGAITCASAHRIAKALNMEPLEIGVQIDLLEFRITECQLGLFGYSNGRKRIDPDVFVGPLLNDQLDQAATDNKLSCRECWDIADRLKSKRLDLGSACEKKNIRIKPCQLGSF